MTSKQLLIMRISILAFTALMCAVFRKPEFMYCIGLMLFFRAPKEVRKNVHERFLDVEYKLEQIAERIEQSKQAPIDVTALTDKLDALIERNAKEDERRKLDNIHG